MSSENSHIKSPFKKDGLFNEAHPLVFDLAKQLRKNMTHAEMILWGYLKSNFEGLRFRRQHPLNMYIADFYCHKLKLIIEVDGSIHDNDNVKQNDLKREADLIEMGCVIIRFTNERVEKETNKVLEEIKIEVNKLKMLK